MHGEGVADTGACVARYGRHGLADLQLFHEGLDLGHGGNGRVLADEQVGQLGTDAIARVCLPCAVAVADIGTGDNVALRVYECRRVDEADLTAWVAVAETPPFRVELSRSGKLRCLVSHS